MKDRLQRVAVVSSGPPLSLKVLYCLQAMRIKPDVIDLGGTSPARYSRYRGNYRAEPPQPAGVEAVSTYGDAVAAYCHENAIGALVGADILSTAVVHEAKGRLPEVTCFPSAGMDTLELLDDKWRFQQFLVENDLPAPSAVLLEALDQVDSKVKGLRFPLVVKPLHGESSHGVVVVHDSDGLRDHLFSGLKYSMPPLLVQEYAEGVDADISLLALNGEVLCHVFHKRTDGCVLEFSEDAAVLEIAKKIISIAAYTGVANIDVRVDKSAGLVKVLECNPRFWYTLQAALWRGMNFIEVGFLAALGERLTCMAPTDGRYLLHGCLLRSLLRNPMGCRDVPRYNLSGLLQAMSDPMPYLVRRN